MKTIVLFAFLAATVVSCKKKDIPPSRVIHDLVISNISPVADGTTILDVYVYIDSQADADKRNVIFTASSGMFISSKDTVVTQAATFENGQLVARVKFQVPLIPGSLIIKAKPALQNQFGNYQIIDTIQIQPSFPKTIKLIPSLLGLRTGFNNEISLVATLKNEINTNVSLGTKVVFDQYGLNGQPVGGIFRISRDTTDATSTVTASYTAGTTVAGTGLFIRCTYIDPFGNPSFLKDSCLITITN